MEDTPEDKTSEAEIEDSVVESEADTGKKHISEGSFHQSESASLSVDIGDYYKAHHARHGQADDGTPQAAAFDQLKAGTSVPGGSKVKTEETDETTLQRNR